MNLRELSNQVERINDYLIESGGEFDSHVMEDSLDSLKFSLERKSENVDALIRNIGASTDRIDNEIKRLQKIKKTQDNARSWLKEYLKDCMEKADIVKWNFPFSWVRVQANNPSVLIDDDSKLPSKYLEVRTETDIKKKDILRDLKAGENVPGASIAPTTTHLRFG